MGFLSQWFGKKKREEAPAPEYIPPTHFRKEEFSFNSFQDISPDEAISLMAQGEVQVLDVRFEYEYRDHRIPSAILIPLPQLAGRYKELDSTKPTLVVCEHGMRSLQACNFLGAKEFKTLYNLVGGMAVYPGHQEGEGVR
ncbi:MAG: rhodanese-like domain-containing protein [Terriglobia bacterium]